MRCPFKTTARRLLAGLLLSASFSASRAADCPPPPAMPTPQQIAPASAAPTAAARDHGLLWRVKTPDGHASYLYGTLHIGRLAWSVPGPALRSAWLATDTLAVELDISNPQTRQALTRAPPLGKPLSPALQARLAAQVRAACLPDATLAALHPLLQVSTLAMLAGRWDELDASFAQETLLLALAQADARRTVALETPQEQLAALIPADPKEVLRSIEEGLEQLEKGEVRAPMLKLAMAWAHSDLAVLQSYEQWCDCIHNEGDRRYLHGLLEARNPVMAARLAALHGGGRRVLAAVGALHMTGPGGLPALLKKMGFEVERLVPAE